MFEKSESRVGVIKTHCFTDLTVCFYFPFEVMVFVMFDVFIIIIVEVISFLDFLYMQKF